MNKYRVYLVAVASTVVEVEAPDGNSAVEAAFDSELPYVPASAGFDLGDWTTSSEIFGTKAEDDYEESA